MNRSPERHWLQLKLHGTQSNRSAIGARVICRSEGRTQVKTVTNSVGYASSSDLRIHFGLDEARTASVEIHWPSGVTQQLSDLRVNQRVDVAEPGGKAALESKPHVSPPSVKR
jgi:hypothetical protein